MKTTTIEDVLNSKRFIELPGLEREFILELMRAQAAEIKEYLLAKIYQYFKDDDLLEELSARIWAKLLSEDRPKHEDSDSTEGDVVIVPQSYHTTKMIKDLLFKNLPRLISVFGDGEMPISSVISLMEASAPLTTDDRANQPGKSYSKFYSRAVVAISNRKWIDCPLEKVRTGVYKIKPELIKHYL